MHTTKYIIELKPNKFETEKRFPHWLEDNGGILSVEPYYDPDSVIGQIREMLLGPEDVSMQGIIDYARCNLRLEPEDGAEFIIHLLELGQKGPVMYDEKADCWMWIEPTSKKQRDLIKNAVRVK